MPSGLTRIRPRISRKAVCSRWISLDLSALQKRQSQLSRVAPGDVAAQPGILHEQQFVANILCRSLAALHSRWNVLHGVSGYHRHRDRVAADGPFVRRRPERAKHWDDGLNAVARHLYSSKRLGRVSSRFTDGVL